MGCDIHFYVERREGGRWVSADEWTTEDGENHVDYKKAYYHNRNYNLFSILADVRNGRGFAGCKTGEGFNPISEPRGIPDDASPEYRAAAESYGEDGHSHSFLTVAEIMAFDWTQTTKLQGVVTPQGWAQWKLSGSPREWSGDVMGHGVTKVPPEVMEGAAKAVLGEERGLWDLYHDKDGEVRAKIDEKFAGKNVYTTVQWEIPYYDAGSDLLSEVLPRLWRLGAPDDVRCCFFFDN
jgi:hypothetical protein